MNGKHVMCMKGRAAVEPVLLRERVHQLREYLVSDHRFGEVVAVVGQAA